MVLQRVEIFNERVVIKALGCFFFITQHTTQRAAPIRPIRETVEARKKENSNSQMAIADILFNLAAEDTFIHLPEKKLYSIDAKWIAMSLHSAHCSSPATISHSHFNPFPSSQHITASHEEHSLLITCPYIDLPQA
jgi:hypothetical protein